MADLEIDDPAILTEPRPIAPAPPRARCSSPRPARIRDSGYVAAPADRFEVTLTVEGVYGYCCEPCEAAGMVGRIVVGRPAGPGALPCDGFADDPPTRHG